MPRDPTADVAAKLDLLRVALLHISAEANDEWTESQSWDKTSNVVHTRRRAWLIEVDELAARWSEELLALAGQRHTG